MIKIKQIIVNGVRHTRKILYNHSNHLSEEELHKYWKNPSPNENQPERYLLPEKRSIFLYKIVQEYLANHNCSILELGCNVGRNLNVLYKHYKNLSGIEISSNALKLGRQTYCSLYKNANFYNSNIKDQLTIFSKENRKFDLIFSMAVLQHIHYTAIDRVLDLIVKLTDLIILIEDEGYISERHFPRDYEKLLEKRGFKQLKEIKRIQDFGFNSDFILRIFKK